MASGELVNNYSLTNNYHPAIFQSNFIGQLPTGAVRKPAPSVNQTNTVQTSSGPVANTQQSTDLQSEQDRLAQEARQREIDAINQEYEANSQYLGTLENTSNANADTARSSVNA